MKRGGRWGFWVPARRRASDAGCKKAQRECWAFLHQTSDIKRLSYLKLIIVIIATHTQFFNFPGQGIATPAE